MPIQVARYQQEKMRITQSRNYPEHSHRNRNAVDIGNHDSLYFDAPFDLIVKLANYGFYDNRLAAESLYPVLFPDGRLDYQSMILYHDNREHTKDSIHLRGVEEGFYKEGKAQNVPRHLHLETAVGKHQGQRTLVDGYKPTSSEIINARNIEDCLYLKLGATIVDGFPDGNEYLKPEDQVPNMHFSRISDIVLADVENSLNKTHRRITLTKSTPAQQIDNSASIIQLRAGIPYGLLSIGHNRDGIVGCTCFVRGKKYVFYPDSGAKVEDCFPDDKFNTINQVRVRRNTAVYGSVGSTAVVGTIRFGQYNVHSTSMHGSTLWVGIVLGGIIRYVPLGGEVEQVTSTGWLPVGRLPFWYKGDAVGRLDLAAAKVDELNALVPTKQQEYEAAKQKADIEQAARANAENAVRKKEAVVDGLVASTPAKVAEAESKLHKNMNENKTLTNRLLDAALAIMQQIIAAFVRWYGGTFGKLEKLANNMRNPVNGKKQSIEQVYESLFEEHAEDALTAADYDGLNMAAAAFDRYNLTALGYITYGKVALV